MLITKEFKLNKKGEFFFLPRVICYIKIKEFHFFILLDILTV